MTEYSLDVALLKQYSPFKLMQEKSLNEILLKTELIALAKGKMLFKRGDERTICHWLVEGKLDLVNEAYETHEIGGDGEPNTEMLEEKPEYQQTAVAVEDCQLLTIKPDDLDLVLTVDQVNEGNEEDWMTRLLQSRLFELVPPANIQTLFEKFETCNFDSKDVVITEGEVGDYFYVVKKGRLSIDRGQGDDLMHLAQIGPGSFFGEDALVRNEPRNATITMLSPGILMRLGKEDFTGLLVEPATDFVTLEEVIGVIAGGEQTISFIDVRHEEEFKDHAEELSKFPLDVNNVPLPKLREQTAELSHEVVYVVITDGRRGELGAFILNQAGFDTYLLRH